MSAPDYTAFDAALLAHIDAGRNTMMVLDGMKDLLALAKPICQAAPGRFKPPEWRIIDRRLQALRKREVIVFDRKAGWMRLKKD
ncbi:hypothetical protein [Azohydromonas aeria]|uniref:hypothetical protein n=1 Tax=Azohydromonas aeria TaxID=2590212 RepID=UPI0012F7A70D|nr:hypothetical protein [Azohydromonas aeria]